MSFRWTLWSLASPSQLILFCLLLGALLLALGRTRAGRVLVSSAAAALFIFGVLPTAQYMAAALESRFPQPQLPPRLTGIILLAGSERPDTSASSGEPQVGPSGGRHLTAQRIARQHPEARVVFSGRPLREPGKGTLETETGVAAALLRQSGLDPQRVTIEQESFDTCDTPANVRRLVHPQPDEAWVVVTSALHMPRTIACFRAAGWGNVIAQPADYRVAPGRWSPGSLQIVSNLGLLDDAAHEWLGLAYYRLAGRTREWFPEPGFDPPQPSP